MTAMATASSLEILPYLLDDVDYSQAVAYHPETRDIATFVSPNGNFWIGTYNSFCTHCSKEPAYSFIRGDFDDLSVALETMCSLSKDA